MGSELFSVLTWLCLAAGLSAGLFFTSDCLSEEKREGTLGLLFLTDLRGYDVALGKLLATSLRGFYALLAVLPILAITQLMGGITGAQYWKSSLALVNALFVSLAAGMAVSALSRDSQKALMATLFVLLLLALGGPLADAIIAGTKQSRLRAAVEPVEPRLCVGGSQRLGPLRVLDGAGGNAAYRLGHAGAGLRAGAAHLAGQKAGGREHHPELGLCLEVWRGAAAATAAPEADRAAPGGVAGLPGALAVAGAVGHGRPGGRRFRGRADRGGSEGSLDYLELSGRVVHVASVPVGGVAGVPVFRGGAAERAARVAAGDAGERAGRL